MFALLFHNFWWQLGTGRTRCHRRLKLMYQLAQSNKVFGTKWKAARLRQRAIRQSPGRNWYQCWKKEKPATRGQSIRGKPPSTRGRGRSYHHMDIHFENENAYPDDQHYEKYEDEYDNYDDYEEDFNQMATNRRPYDSRRQSYSNPSNQCYGQTNRRPYQPSYQPHYPPQRQYQQTCDVRVYPQPNQQNQCGRGYYM